jgi:hypothetical protein
MDGACKACSSKMKVSEAVENEELPFLDEMSGHPSMRRYLNDGYRIIVFWGNFFIATRRKFSYE